MVSHLSIIGILAYSRQYSFFSTISHSPSDYTYLIYGTYPVGTKTLFRRRKYVFSRRRKNVEIMEKMQDEKTSIQGRLFDVSIERHFDTIIRRLFDVISPLQISLNRTSFRHNNSTSFRRNFAATNINPIDGPLKVCGN